MDIDTWFKDKRNIRKSQKNYAHFDIRTDIMKSQKYITNPENISKHGFYPFIKYTLRYERYRKVNNEPEREDKERIICYSAHIDRCIYQYYSALLNERYNLRLKQDWISKVPVAYRTDLHISNIDIFKEVIDVVRSMSSCYVLIGGFTKFFDRINHGYLKKQLCNLLDVSKLPSDYFAVFKSITKYNTWDLTDILALNNFSNNRRGIKMLNSKKRVLSKDAYKANKSHIVCNDSGIGIPQGSSISACFANIYMLEVDKKISDFVKGHNGIYRRYSDDFIIVLPDENNTHEYIEQIIQLFENYKKQNLMELQPVKTQVFKINGYKLRNIGNTFQPMLNNKNKYINFLGFTFDGDSIHIRSKTISKYFYRMRHKAIGIARKYSENHGFKGSDKLYRMYSSRGQYGKGNFFTYLRHAEEKFPNESIGNPTKNHMVKIRRILKKNKR